MKKPNKQLNSHQILVKVIYSGVNRADLSQKAGKYLAPPGHSPILGLEVYGQVIALGSGVTRFKIGDLVMSLVNGGGYAEECIVEESIALLQPDFLTAEQCAAIPEVYMTTLLNLLEIGNLVCGQTVLIHAGGSGVGIAAIQLAKLLKAQVITTVRSKSKITICQELGADVVILQDEIIDYAAQIKQRGLQIDLSLNPVGGKYINEDLHCMALGAKLINIGLMGGVEVNLDLSLVLRNNLQIIGSTIRNKSNEIKARLRQKIEEIVLPAVHNQQIKIIIDKIFTLAEVEQAHQYMQQNHNIGKILLKHH